MSSLAIHLTAVLLAFVMGLGTTQIVRHARSRLARNTHQTSDLARISVAQKPTTITSTCSNEAPLSSLAGTVECLNNVKPTEYFEVSISTQELLRRLKHQLRDFVAERITEDADSLPAEALRIRLIEQLAKQGVIIKDDETGEEGHFFGDVYDLKVERPSSPANLIVVTITLGIPCGSDSSLYIFQRTEQQWRLALAQEANDYDQISGAQGLFDYAISPLDSNNEFFILTGNVNPWCTSNWQGIRYSALRFGATAYQPQIIAAGEETIYLGVDPPPYKLEVAKKWFSITFEGNSSPVEISDGINSRKHVLKYAVISRDVASRVHD